MSKAIGKILGSRIVTDKNYVDENRGNIVPYTKFDGSIGYNLVDKRPEKLNTTLSKHIVEDNLKYLHLKDLNNPILDAGNKDYMRNLWQEQNQQSLRPYDNYLTGDERIEQLHNGNNLFLDIENNPNANYEMPLYTIQPIGNYIGKHYVDKYSGIIEKYAQQYNVDADLVKAIMYNEGATGHDLGYNYYKDIQGTSKSQMPMNIRKDKWGIFDGKQYDTDVPEQNIELAIKLIKRLQNSIHNPTIEKVATLYNSTGAMKVNDYGARTKTIYNQRPWFKEKIGKGK